MILSPFWAIDVVVLSSCQRSCCGGEYQWPGCWSRHKRCHSSSKKLLSSCPASFLKCIRSRRAAHVVTMNYIVWHASRMDDEIIHWVMNVECEREIIWKSKVKVTTMVSVVKNEACSFVDFWFWWVSQDLHRLEFLIFDFVLTLENRAGMPLQNCEQLDPCHHEKPCGPLNRNDYLKLACVNPKIRNEVC